MGNGKSTYYIASYVFTSKYPKLSNKIQQYFKEKFHARIVRCCTPKYKLKKYEDLMPEPYHDTWCALPDSGHFEDGDTVYSICHNCTDILEETKPLVKVKSVWEQILTDETFPYLDYHGKEMAIQDCWRSYDKRAEQDAVRQLAGKMNIKIIELPNNYEKADFCGTTLYSPCVKRNAVLAPHRFVENAEGKFGNYSEDEKKEIMQEYVSGLPTRDIITYCHYCQTGLELGGANAVHLASLLFASDKI